MLKGCVRFECEGGFPERFLNEATRLDVALWDVSRQGISLFGWCRAGEYRRLRLAARAASMRMHVTQKRGLPFLLRPFRLRFGLVIGAALFLVLLQGLSSRVWIVRVSGNERIPEAEIREVLRPLGVYEGASFAKVDLPTLQLSALQALPDVVWLTVNQKGSVLQVEIKERSPTVSVVDNEPANVIASHDGVIVSIHATTGQATVKPGDAVTKGSLLISGVMDSKVGPQLKRAAGMVTARTKRTLTVTVPFEEEVPKAAPRILSRPSFYVLGLRIPLYTSGTPQGEYTERVIRYPLRAYRETLPIGMEVTQLVFDETECLIRSEEEALHEARRRLEEQQDILQQTATVETEQLSEQKTATGWTLVGTYTCLESIGVTQSFQMHEKR